MSRESALFVGVLAMAMPCLSGQSPIQPASAAIPGYFVARSAGPKLPHFRRFTELFAADVDGDARPEILYGIDLFNISGVTTGPGFSYRKALGNGEWAQGPVYPITGAGIATRCTVVAVGDVDGNGTVDAIMDRWYHPLSGVPTPYPLVLWRGDGAGGFTDGSALLPGVPTIVYNALLEDVDRDGDLDLFLCADPSCLLYLNNGSGLFTDVTASRVTPTLPNQPRCVAPIDADQDGDRDLFVMFWDGTPPRLFVNQGGFLTGVDQGLGGSGAVPLVLDANHDGWDDVLAIYDARAPAMFLSVAGQTVMQQAPWMVPVSGLGFFAAAASAAIDVDHDGDLDIVLERMSRIDLWINTGAGFVDESNQLPWPGSRLYMNKVHVDFDLDGDQDLLLGATATHEVWLSSTHREAIALTQPVRGSEHKVSFMSQADHALLIAASLVPLQVALPGLGWLFLDPHQGVFLQTLVFRERQQQIVHLAIPNLPVLAGVPLGLQGLDLDVRTGLLQTTNCPWRTIQ